MNDDRPADDSQTRFEELANGYRPKLSRKFALLLPFKTHIEGLLARRASYDDIRLLLEDAKVVVSKNTLYRFCLQVIGKKTVRQGNGGIKKNPTLAVSPAPIQIIKPPLEAVETVLPGQRERYAGPWSKRKPVPRIADSQKP